MTIEQKFNEYYKYRRFVHKKDEKLTEKEICKRFYMEGYRQALLYVGIETK